MRADQPSWIAIEPQVTALVENPLQVFSVGGVIAVIDLHACEVHAFFFEDRELAPCDVARGVGVHHDRHTRLAVCAGDSAGHDFERRCDAFKIRRALQHASLDIRAAKTFLNIAHKLAGHLIRANADQETWHIEPPARDVDDVYARTFGHRCDKRGIATEIERRGVDHGVDAVRLGTFQTGNGARFAIGAKQVGITGMQTTCTHHHVLVHQREAELAAVHRTQDRIDLAHVVLLPCRRRLRSTANHHRRRS